MKLLKLFSQKSPWIFWLAAALGVLGGIAGMGLIAQVNRALAGGVSTTALGVFALLCLARLSFSLSGTLLFQRLAQGTVYDLRLRLSRAILAMPLRELETLGPAKLLGALSEDVLVLARAGTMLSGVITQVAFVLGCAVYLGTLSMAGLGIVALVLLLGIGVVRILSAQAGRVMKMAREDQDTMFEGLGGLIAGTKELKLHASRRADFLTRSLEAPSVAFRKKEGRSAALGFAAAQWQSLLFLVLVGLLLFETPRLHLLDAPVLRSCVLAVLFMQSSVQNLLQFYPSMQKADVALGKLAALGLSVAAAAEPADDRSLARCQTIELRGVVHEYRGEEGDGVFVLGPIDLVVRPGEVLFVVGGNGSGKSTLVKLLTGLYAPQSGEVRLDGRLVDAASRSGYRQLFSAVFSDWYLFEDLHGIDGRGLEADAQRYLQELRLDKKVTVRDGAFSTTALSQGQRKRLMLLTAYLEDRAVYVFDEWASDQDPIFKELFYLHILKRLKERQKAVVVVSHDDRYFSAADRIVRLESGKAVPDVAHGREPTS